MRQQNVAAVARLFKSCCMEKLEEQALFNSQEIRTQNPPPIEIKCTGSDPRVLEEGPL